MTVDPETHHFTAHRGLSGRYPENTVHAFIAAADERFKAIETDIWEVPGFFERVDDRTGFVIMHNGDLSRMCGVDLPVKELTQSVADTIRISGGNGNRADIEYTIPTLEDFLEIMQRCDKEIVLEIKDEDISREAAEKLIAVLDEGGSGGRAVLGSFHKRSLTTLKDILDGRDDYAFTKFIGTRDKLTVDEQIKWSADHGIDIISMRKTMITDKILTDIKSYGMKLETWVVNDAAEAETLFARGVDRITTNDVLW